MKEGKLKIRKEKKIFNKNSSFSGVGTKKSPENRRKSIAAMLPLHLKKKKTVKNFNEDEWTVSDSDTKNVKRKQLIVTDNSEELVDLEVNTLPLESSTKTKKKKSKSGSITKDDKNSIEKTAAVVSNKKKKKAEVHAEPEVNSDNDAAENDEKFGIKSRDITKAINAVIELQRINPKLQNQLLEERVPLFLNLSCHKVPIGPSRIIRIPVPNSLLTPDDEICLIVPEVKGVKNIEYEKHIEHYEDLLKRKGVDNIKKVMTFHEFRTEYETYEQKCKLVDLYDVFLVDGRISGKVVGKGGKVFYMKRKVPTAVKLQATKLKEHLEKALCKAFFMLHLKGDCYCVQFGHDKMEVRDLVDNVLAVIEGLSKDFPGGFENFKGMGISASRTTSLPIYSSFKNPTNVKTPKIIPKKPKAYKTYEGELTTVLNANVVVEPTGKITVKRTKLEDDSVTDTNTEVETVNDNEKSEKKTKKSKNDIVLPEDTNQDSQEKTVKKTKKKKHNIISSDITNLESQTTAADVKNNAEADEDNSEVTKIKKVKKRKHSEVVSVEAQHEEPQKITVTNKENIVKKKKKTKVSVDVDENEVVSKERLEEEVKTKKEKAHKKKAGKVQEAKNKESEAVGKADSLVEDVNQKKKKSKKIKS